MVVLFNCCLFLKLVFYFLEVVNVVGIVDKMGSFIEESVDISGYDNGFNFILFVS